MSLGKGKVRVRPSSIRKLRLICLRDVGSDLTIQDIERILHYMVIENILREQFEVQQPYGTVVAYMQVN